ncbi:MAG: proline--tRNA ligase [Candidatus Hatepunaea meridiana]|nr:proline--tRNA ligase [Candidatus Hatepunaea meridiana]
MQRSHYFIPTLKETPAEAIALSHRLMLRAGLIRMLSAGIYSYLPLGWSAMRKASQIVREEMDRIGGQEFQLPALNAIEVWDETGRNKEFGDEMFRLTDRKGHVHCLAPTHEEIICANARGQLRSWRDLPQIWYQIQTKFRDEPRPRGGVLRMRQFIMKDAYSLDRDEEGLDRSYELHSEAYKRIFQRCGLEFFIVGASSGLMGGSKSQEFMFESEAGEDEVARCDNCEYAANMEVASSRIDRVEGSDPCTLTEVATPDQRTVEEVSTFLNIPKDRLVKTLVYVNPSGLIMALVSGDDELSEDKFTAIAGGPIRPATAEEVMDRMGADIGFLGPHGDHKIPIFADLRLKDCSGLATGANRNGYHVMGLEFGRDVVPDKYVDLRKIKDGENCPSCGKLLRIVRSIELGHIFKLGTKYSAAMGAVYLDETGVEKPIVMGSYGIGIERILAAAIECNADEYGVRWNSALTPLDAIVIPLNSSDEAVVKQADEIYTQLTQAGFKTLLDDRDARPGMKMKDADLIGIPTQVIVSPRNLEKGIVEIKSRWSGERSYVKPEEVKKVINDILNGCKPIVSQ